ncbi:MAG: DUF4349 domain-containing protein, partial [Actinomycetota bacterium]
DDVAAASQQAVAAVEALGGVVFGQDATNDPAPRSVFTFKVDPSRFQDALASLAELGVPRSQTVTADDVTERVVDLESRVRTAETSVERLRALLEGATDLEAVAQLETQLLERETALEQLRGQLRTLRDQVALATIVATFSSSAPVPAIEVVQTADVGSLDDDLCPGSRRLEGDEGDEVVVCVSAVNSGDTMLTGIEVSDAAFEVGIDDLTVIEGDLDEPLAPTERLIVAYAVTAEPGTFPDLRVTAEPTDAAGSAVREVLTTQITTVEWSVAESDALPGFGDAVGAGVGLLAAIVGIAVVVVGVVVPFLWLVPVVWLGLLVRRRRLAPTAGAS